MAGNQSTSTPLIAKQQWVGGVVLVEEGAYSVFGQGPKRQLERAIVEGQARRSSTLCNSFRRTRWLSPDFGLPEPVP